MPVESVNVLLFIPLHPQEASSSDQWQQRHRKIGEKFWCHLYASGQRLHPGAVLYQSVPDFLWKQAAIDLLWGWKTRVPEKQIISVDEPKLLSALSIVVSHSLQKPTATTFLIVGSGRFLGSLINKWALTTGWQSQLTDSEMCGRILLCQAFRNPDPSVSQQPDILFNSECRDYGNLLTGYKSGIINLRTQSRRDDF